MTGYQFNGGPLDGRKLDDGWPGDGSTQVYVPHPYCRYNVDGEVDGFVQLTFDRLLPADDATAES